MDSYSKQVLHAGLSLPQLTPGEYLMVNTNGEIVGSTVNFTIPGQVGGEDGKVIRLTDTPNTWVNASNTDHPEKLVAIAFRLAGKYYPPNSVIELGGLTPGAVYYLGSSGAYVTSPVIPSSSVVSVCLGRALNASLFLFVPSIPVAGS